MDRLWLFVALISAVECLYFHIPQTQKKCFIEDIPDETIVVGEIIGSTIMANEVPKCADHLKAA